jgi:hypothetical protein
MAKGTSRVKLETKRGEGLQKRSLVVTHLSMSSKCSFEACWDIQKFESLTLFQVVNHEELDAMLVMIAY